MSFSTPCPHNEDEEIASLSEQYLAIASYTVEEDDGSRLPFSSGDKLSVYNKAEDGMYVHACVIMCVLSYDVLSFSCCIEGWWLAEVDGRSGWVPSTYLIRLEAGPEDQDTCLVTPGTHDTTGLISCSYVYKVHDGSTCSQYMLSLHVVGT